MTKKNKLLSLVCLAVLSLVCAFGMMFSGSASTAKAETALPIVDSSAIVSRDVSIAPSDACSGGSTNINIIYTNGAKNVDYIVIEYTNVVVKGNGGNTFFYGAGKSNAHAKQLYSVNADAYNGIRVDDGNVKFYYNTTTGDVSVLVNDETEYVLAALTPVADPVNTASPFAICFHAISTDGLEIKDVKAYSITGTTVKDTKLNFGDNFIREDINFPTVPVTSDVVGANYTKESGGAYISTANPTNDEWIIFEITDGGTTAMAASNNFYFGLGTSAGDSNATDNSVADWSPIIIKDGATGRYWLNTKTGDIFKSTNALTETPVLEPLTVGGLPVYTNKNVGVSNVYGKIYFNANVTKIDFTNVKAYDSQGNDLGIKTNLPINLPTPDVAEVETTNLKISTPQGYMANAKAPASGANWVIFDYNPVNNGLRGGNPENSFHMAVKNDGSFGSGAMPLYIGNFVTTAEHVRVLVNIKTGDAYYERDGKNTYFKTFALPTFAEGQYPTVTMMFNIFESAGSAGADGIACLRLNNIKVYDDLGNDLGLKTTGNWVPELPAPDSSEMTANSVIFDVNCGGNGYLAYDNAIVNAGAVGEGAKYLIFEYTNAETNNVGGGNGAFIGLGNKTDRIQHNKNGAHVLFEASSTIKLYVNVETGEVSYYKNGEYSVLNTLTVPALADGQYVVFNFAPHTPATKPVIVYDVKCYDDLGNEIGIKVGGNCAILGTEPTIENTATATNYEAVSGSVAFSNATGTTSEWIVFEWTNGAENTATATNNGFYVGISTTANPTLTANKLAAKHIARVFGATGKKVKLYFNTREGYIGYAVEGLTADGDIRIVATGLTTTDGTTPVYAKIDTISSVVGLFNDFKCYDGEGNDLGETTTFVQEVHVTFASTSIAAQASRWLMYWSIKNVATQEDLHFSYNISSFIINGSETALAASIAAYDVGGVHCWIFNYSALFINGETEISQVAPLTITMEAGHVFKVGNIKYVLDNTFYIYISGTNAVVSTTEREEISLLTEDADTNFIYGSTGGGRYQGDLYALIGGEKQVLPIYNIALKKFGTEDLVVRFEHAVVGGDPISYAEISKFGATESYTELVNQWYVLPAGSIIGNVYVTDVDYIIQINKDTFNIFAKDKVFNVTFDNLQGAEAPVATTFSYADGNFNVELPSISNPEGFVFDGWTYGGGDITAITPGMFGKDITVTAKLSDAEALFAIQEKASVTLQSSIALTFYVKATVYDVNTLTANFAFAYADGLTKTAVGEFVENSRVNDNVAFYTVTYYGILPQHIADDVNLTVKNGDVELDTYSASVVDYISALLAVTDPTIAGTDEAGLALLKTLACDLVEYGTAMQEMISHDVENTPKAILGDYDNVATEFVSAEGADDYKKVGEADVSYYWKGATFVYNNVPQLVFTFVAPETANLAVTLNFVGDDVVYPADSVVKVSDNAGEGLAVYSVTYNFVPYTFDKVVEVKIFDAEVQMGQTLEYSVNAYIANILESATTEELATLKAIYNYGVSAKAYDAYIKL